MNSGRHRRTSKSIGKRQRADSKWFFHSPYAVRDLKFEILAFPLRASPPLLKIILKYVIPAQAGIHLGDMDPRFRGGDLVGDLRSLGWATGT